MSGTNSTATTRSGVPISSLPAAKDVAANDGVFGVFGGEAKLADPKTLVSAGLPEDVVRTGDLDEALSDSSLGQYTAQAAQHADAAKTGAAQSQTGAAASAASAGQAAQTGVQVAAIAESAKTNNDAAQQAVAGVTGTANSAAVMLTAALDGDAPLTYRGYWNAATNSPALTSGSGEEGDLYIVSVAGATALDGNAVWSAQDGAWFHNGAWQYFSRAGWPAFAQAITAARRVNIGRAGAGLGAHTGGWLWAITNDQGFIGGGIDPSGNFRFPSEYAQIGPATLQSGSITKGLLLTDRYGFVGFDSSYSFGQSVAGFTAAELVAYDRANRDHTATVWQSGFLTGQRPVCDYNGELSLGQSEQNGEMALPLLPYLFSSASVGALMVGNSARCTDPMPTNTAWLPVGGTYKLNPLADLAWNQVAGTPIVRSTALLNTATPSSITISADGLTVTSNDPSIDFTKCFAVGDGLQFSGFTGSAAWMNLYGTPTGNEPWNGQPTQSFGGKSYVFLSAVTSSTLTLASAGQSGTYSNVTVALYLPLEPSLGQDQSAAAAIYEAALTLDRPNNRKYVCGNACVGGQTLAQLSKGASPDIFQRVGQWAQALVQTVKSVDSTATVCIHVTPFGQGGSDLTTDYATYKAQLLQYVSDVRTAIKSATGQILDPFFEAFVISGGNMPDADHLGVVRAQMDAIIGGEIDNAYIVGPGYFVPDYLAHWSSNGERWFGAQRAKVRDLVIRRRHGWEPMRILSAYYRGFEIVLNLHVPYAPAQIKPTFVGQAYETLSTYGFVVRDSAGNTLTIKSVEVNATTIRIAVTSPLSAPPTITYADQFGTGNICDSDPAVSFDNYTWTAGSGQPFTENIPELVGKPYPLNNWLCPDSIVAEPA